MWLCVEGISITVNSKSNSTSFFTLFLSSLNILASRAPSNVLPATPYYKRLLSLFFLNQHVALLRRVNFSTITNTSGQHQKASGRTTVGHLKQKEFFMNKASNMLQQTDFALVYNRQIRSNLRPLRYLFLITGKAKPYLAVASDIN